MENRFDIYNLPEGHETRFEARLDKHLARRHRRSLVFRWTAVAASLALVVLPATQSRQFAIRKAQTPEGVYTAYLKEVGKLYEALADNSDNEIVDWESLLHELTDENLPLYDQLPEELSQREKTRILKQHYGGILHEAGQLKGISKKQ